MYAMDENEKEHFWKKFVIWALVISTLLLTITFCCIFRCFTVSGQSYLYLENKHEYLPDIVYPSWTYIKNDTLYVSKVLSGDDKEVLYSFVSKSDSCYLSYKNNIDYLSYTLSNNSMQVKYFIILIVLMSLIGCNVRSMYDYVGNYCYKNKLEIKRWWPWYLLRPCIAISLGLLLFICSKADIIEFDFSSNTNNIIIISFFVGFALQDVVKLLRNISKSIFVTEDKTVNSK